MRKPALAGLAFIACTGMAHAETCEVLNDKVAKNGSWTTYEFLAKQYGPSEMTFTQAFNWARVIVAYCDSHPYDDLGSVLADPVFQARQD